MAHVNEIIGTNAGKVWRILNENKELSPRAIKRKTKMRDEEFYQAVGWLARENKICRKGEYYCLGETNLTGEIGGHAGEIWHALNKNERLSVRELGLKTKLNPTDIYSAIGWLARENKIDKEGAEYKLKK